MKRSLRIWLFFYLAAYCFPFPLGLLPGTAFIIESYFAAKIKLAAWVGNHFLGLQHVSIVPSGSGDTLANYILIGILAVSSFLTAMLWTIFASSKNTERIQTLIYNYVRVVLASLLVSYGWSKIILPGQFGSLTPGRLIESFGESSPMGLLWTFMAASKPYTIFSGLLEVLAGSLLFIPRFVRLGSVLAIGIMANVFALNLCYDVPVKLFSFHLLVLAIFLFAPDWNGFFRFFILNLPTEPKRAPRLLQTPPKIIYLAEVLFVLAISISAILSGIKGARSYEKSIEEVKFFGAWNVMEFSALNGGDLLIDSWARIAFDLDDQFYVRTSKGEWLRFQFQLDDSKKEINLIGTDGLPSSAHFSYSQPTMAELLISGQLDSRMLSFRLQKISELKVPLQERGFRWITDRPFER